MLITIEPRFGGMTVREFVLSELGLSRGLLTRLKSLEKGILLNGERVTVRAVLHEGDTLLLETEDFDTDVNERIEPVDIPIEILYEDDEVVAVNKGAAMPTHPSHNHHNDTLANALAWRYKQMGIPFVFRAVNRLDADTSGIVLVARNRMAAFKMSNELSSGNISKRYIAVLDGVLEHREGSITAPIRRKSDSIILRECCREGEGDYARTDYTLLCENGTFCAVEARPITGRTHQIRVHFAHIGLPLVGDYLYGKEGQCGMKRHALHAYKLSFNRPSDGKRIELTADMPEDIKTLYSEING
jgi:23S rRNA pseudouridine1911/1915/1917 synthase